MRIPLGLVAGLALLSFSCVRDAGAPVHPVPPVELAPSGPARDTPAAKAVGDAKSAAPPAATAERTADVPPRPLARFEAALEALRTSSAGVVRVAWFGDSHTAADFLPGEVRRRLQARFGNGGPGFLQVGNVQMRHDDVRSEVSGKWHARPAAPAGYRPAGDLRVGLAGVATEPGLGARVRVALPPGAEVIHWQLLFETPRPGATFEIVSEAGTRLIRADEASTGVDARRSGLLSVSFDTVAPHHAFELRRILGGPVFHGVIAEAPSGVVVDTYGINGARVKTVLSWQSDLFEGELAERSPDLVVLAYGTNETGDGGPVANYKQFYERVLERVRRAAPKADCLLVGPTDRRGKEKLPLLRAREIDAFQRQLAQQVGCGYFSLYDVMGGPGGFGHWASEHPALATSDGVHLTIGGYRRLGEALSKTLLSQWAESTGGGLPEAPLTRAGEPPGAPPSVIANDTR